MTRSNPCSLGSVAAATAVYLSAHYCRIFSAGRSSFDYHILRLHALVLSAPVPAHPYTPFVLEMTAMVLRVAQGFILPWQQPSMRKEDQVQSCAIYFSAFPSKQYPVNKMNFTSMPRLSVPFVFAIF